MAGNWGKKGCYAYTSGKYKGHGYYGLYGTREITKRRQMNNLSAGMVRLEGFPKCGSGNQKAVSRGCYADGGSRDGGRKSGRNRAVPKYVGAFGCGQAGKDRCMAAAK